MIYLLEGIGGILWLITNIQSRTQRLFSVRNYRNIALSYSILDAAEPTNETMKLVDQYVDGKIEISDALEKTIERYRNLAVAHD